MGIPMKNSEHQRAMLAEQIQLIYQHHRHSETPDIRFVLVHALIVRQLCEEIIDLDSRSAASIIQTEGHTGPNPEIVGSKKRGWINKLKAIPVDLAS